MFFPHSVVLFITDVLPYTNSHEFECTKDHKLFSTV